MWDTLLEFGDGAWESVGEAWDIAVDAAEAAVKQTALGNKEAATDPQTLKNAEPLKGNAADGSTVIAATASPRAPLIAGVDNTTLLLGGVALVVLLVVARR